jgi:hypothetical protein
MTSEAMARVFEVGLAIAAAVAGVAALIIDLTAPLNRFQAEGPAGHVEGGQSLFEAGLAPPAWAFTVVIACLCVALAAGAIADARSRSGWALGVVCVSTLLILAGAVISLASLGLTLLPAVLLALLTVASAVLGRR